MPILFLLACLAYILFGVFADKVHLITSPVGWSFYGAVMGAFILHLLTLGEE